MSEHVEQGKKRVAAGRMETNHGPLYATRTVSAVGFTLLRFCVLKPKAQTCSFNLLEIQLVYYQLQLTDTKVAWYHYMTKINVDQSNYKLASI